ncbi:hypothetical protein [Lentzea sp. NPDC051838]|uniref:hypothetical protein n=1 Tax=Lentzea sp. NPDC051838 TaxID=3154849 RepID=UPI0034426C9B
MRKLMTSAAAFLALGALVTPAAHASEIPVYDPGSTTGSKFVFVPSTAGGEGVSSGKFVEYTVSLDGTRTRVKDLADDGLDVHLWVQYGKTNEYTHKEMIATASGLNATTFTAWYSPADMYVNFFAARVCVGPGEDRCSHWIG